MAAFCNQFDKVATELGCAVIYCHHHSKGAQGGKKSQDRASGSGVFARDPDAMLDMSELPVSESMRAQQQNAATADICLKWLRRFRPDWHELASQDDQCSAVRMMDICRANLPERSLQMMQSEINDAKNRIAGRTAWRIEPTLREFPAFPPRDLWFDYPVHRCDVDGLLRDVKVETPAPWGGNKERKKTPQERSRERRERFDTAYEACSAAGKVTVAGMAEYMGCTEKTVRNHAQQSGGYSIEDSIIIRNETEKTG